MNRKLYTGIVLLFCFMVNMSAQQTKNAVAAKNMIVELTPDQIFDKVIDYLHDSGYFIVTMDKDAGFIQAKILFKKGTHFFTGESDEIRILNFFIRPEKENESKITLDMYCKQKKLVGSGGAVYYEDQGKVNDLSIYKDIMNGLKNILVQ